MKVTSTIEMDQPEFDLFTDRVACHRLYGIDSPSYVSSAILVDIVNDMLQKAFDLGRSYDSEV